MTNRWHEKADALSAAWDRMYGARGPLGRAGVALALAPAQLETRCGDAWPGPDGLAGTADDERNWGACTLRSLNAEEQAALDDTDARTGGRTGAKPTVGSGHVVAARMAMADLRAAGLTPPSGLIGNSSVSASGATLHCDSRTTRDAQGRPIVVPYFVWFANFATHVDGAAYYLHLLGERARGVIEAAAGSTALASAMYAKGYFWGFKPHSTYVDAAGATHDGNAENVEAYARLIRSWLPKIEVGLADWRVEPAKPAISLSDIAAVLNVLSVSRPPLAPGADPYGFTVTATIGAFQSGARDANGKPLNIDGKAGPLTRAAMKRDLEAKGYRVK